MIQTQKFWIHIFNDIYDTYKNTCLTLRLVGQLWQTKQATSL